MVYPVIFPSIRFLRQPIRIFLIEDEPVEVAFIKRLLSQHLKDEFVLIGQADTASPTVQADINALKPDVVLLDQGLSGFTIEEKLCFRTGGEFAKALLLDGILTKEQIIAISNSPQKPNPFPEGVRWFPKITMVVEDHFEGTHTPRHTGTIHAFIEAIRNVDNRLSHEGAPDQK